MANNGAVVIANSISADGLRSLHVMASTDEALGDWLARVPEAARAGAKRYSDEMRFRHLEATWQARELVEFTQAQRCTRSSYCQACPLRPDCVWRRQVLLWALEKGQRVRDQILQASESFSQLTGLDPEVAWMKTIPATVVEGVTVGPVVLIQADWVPSGFLALWSTILRGGRHEHK